MRGWADSFAADERQGRQFRRGTRGKAGGAMEAAVQKQQARDAVPDLLGVMESC